MSWTAEKLDLNCELVNQKLINKTEANARIAIKRHGSVTNAGQASSRPWVPGPELKKQKDPDEIGDVYQASRMVRERVARNS